jgi:hypothetical protein
MQEKEKASLLQTTQQAFFQTAATKESAKGLAEERTMDKTTMDAVIADKIASKNKQVRASLHKLENMIRRTTITPPGEAKNSKGGGNTQQLRLQQEKTNARKSTKKLPKKLPNGPRDPGAADASANATSNNGGKKTTKKKPKKKPGKNDSNNANSKP